MMMASILGRLDRLADEHPDKLLYSYLDHGNVPASVATLKALATPNVRTGSEAGESMPALVLSEGKQNTVFYDLSATPPVLRNAAPGSVKFVDGSNWHHTSAIGAYDDAELAAILTFLGAVIQP